MAVVCFPPMLPSGVFPRQSLGESAVLVTSLDPLCSLPLLGGAGAHIGLCWTGFWAACLAHGWDVEDRVS